MNQLISSLGNILQSSAAHTAPKTGQIFSGKVIKLMPEHHAIVQFGQKQVHAKIDPVFTSLTKGHSYLFQLSAGKDVMKLKVVSERKGLNPDIQKLLTKLGIKTTKLDVDFLQTLVKKEIPFQTSDVKAALSILQETGNKKVAKDILLQMLQKQFPMKPSVFHALYTQKTMELSQLFQQLQSDRGVLTFSDERINQLISLIKGGPASSSLSLMETSVMKVISEIATKNPTSFQLFQKAGLLDGKQTFSQFQHNWNKWAGERLPGSDGSTSIQQMQQWLSQTKKSKPPLPASLEKMTQQLKRLFDSQLMMSKTEHQAFSRWMNQLNSLTDSHLKGKPSIMIPEFNKQKLLADHQLLQQKQTFQKLLPLMPDQIKTAFLQVTSSMQELVEAVQPKETKQLRQITGFLRTVQHNQLTPSEKVSLTEWVSRLTSGSSQPIKDSILLKLKAMIDLSGLQDEATMKNALHKEGAIHKEVTLKSSLIQSLQDPHSGMRTETVRQMLSLLNGIQLSAHQETHQSIQMALQFPGSIIGSDKDIHLNMEGRKTKKAEIDPDFCRIVFYLSLEHLKETVVDLNIVSRRVTVTVFNDQDEVKPIVDSYRSLLNQELDSLGYHLSTLQVKRFQASEEPKVRTQSNEEKGVDFRI